MINSPFYNGNHSNRISALVSIEEMLILFSLATPDNEINKNAHLFSQFEINQNEHMTNVLLNISGVQCDIDPYYNGSVESRLMALTVYKEVIAIYRRSTNVNVIKENSTIFRQFNLYEKQFVYSVLTGITEQEIKDTGGAGR